MIEALISADNAVSRNIVASVLASMEIDVSIIDSTFADAIESVNEQFDLLIVSCDDDGSRALNALRETRTRFPDATIVLLVNKPSANASIVALEHGIDHYIDDRSGTTQCLTAIVKRLHVRTSQRLEEAKRISNLKKQRDHLLKRFLNAIPGSALFVTPTQQFIGANALGEETLKRGDTFVLENNTVKPRLRRDWIPFNNALNTISTTTEIKKFPFYFNEDIVADTRDSALMTRYSLPAGDSGESQKVIAIFFGTKSTDEIVSTTALKSFYGLTNAELRLALGLARGEALESLANLYNVSKNTLRVQLQSLYRKTDSSRQHELVTRIFCSVAATRAHTPTSTTFF